MERAWPQEGVERLEACPLCAARERDKLHDGLRDPLFGAPGTWTMWRCRGCRCAYLDPRPTPDTVGAAYASYFHHQEARSPAAEPATALARLRRAVLNGYLDTRHGYDAQPAARLAGRLLRAAPPLAHAADRWIRHLRFAGAAPRLLDVGCANGAFLLQMQALGWDASGIDIDAQALAHARAAGLRVREGTLADLGDEGWRDFDAITLNHVVEHLHDPHDAAARAHALLRPGGVLWMATPNVDALGHRHFGADWYAVDPPRHLILFSRQNLRRLLEGAGFEQIEFPKPLPHARVVFAPSAALARGLNSLEDQPPLSPALRSRAWAAELVTRFRPDRAEEIVVLATRAYTRD